MPKYYVVLTTNKDLPKEDRVPGTPPHFPVDGTEVSAEHPGEVSKKYPDAVDIMTIEEYRGYIKGIKQVYAKDIAAAQAKRDKKPFWKFWR